MVRRRELGEQSTCTMRIEQHTHSPRTLQPEKHETVAGSATGLATDTPNLTLTATSITAPLILVALARSTGVLDAYVASRPIHKTAQQQQYRQYNAGQIGSTTKCWAYTERTDSSNMNRASVLNYASGFHAYMSEGGDDSLTKKIETERRRDKGSTRAQEAHREGRCILVPRIKHASVVIF